MQLLRVWSITCELYYMLWKYSYLTSGWSAVSDVCKDLEDIEYSPFLLYSHHLGHMVSTLRCYHDATCRTSTGKRTQPGTRSGPN